MTDRGELERYPTYQELANALLRVGVGGNHAALIIGAGHPLYTATDDEARTHYGDDQDRYNAWICWREIMVVAREVYDKLAPEVQECAWRNMDKRRQAHAREVHNRP